MQTPLKIDGGLMKASDILEAGIKHLGDRAASYDAPHGERSMSKTVAIFNELIGENCANLYQRKMAGTLCRF